MSHGLSVEVTIPASVEASTVISIGERFSTDGLDEEMTVGDALECAFANPNASALLQSLGVSWHVITTGR